MVQFRSEIPIEQKVVLDNINFAFSLLFGMEIVLKILAQPRDFFRSKQNVFDLVVVSLSIAFDVLNAQTGGTALRALRVVILTRLFYATASFHMLFDVFNRRVSSMVASSRRCSVMCSDCAERSQ